MKERFLIIDGNYVLHRAFWAIAPLYTDDKQLVNAVYGFLSTLIKLITMSKSVRVAVTFDVGKADFRHEKLEAYKAHRTKMDDELASQIPILREMLKVCEVPVFTMEGYEADDVIATLVKRIESETKSDVYIFSGDFDLYQLLSKRTSFFTFEKGGRIPKIITPETFSEKWGIDVGQIIDYKGLCGDSSDNIPGVMGVGKKTALKLLQEYETLDGIYEHIDDIKGALQRKLIDDKENAYLSKEVATLVDDVKFDFEPEECRAAEMNFERMFERFESFKFFTLVKRAKKLQELLAEAPNEPADRSIEEVVKHEEKKLKSKTAPEDSNQQMQLF